MASFAQLFSTYCVGWTDQVMRFLSLTGDSPQGMAINKVLEAGRMVLPILVLVKLSGADLGSLYLKRGNLKVALLLGLGLLLNYGTSVVLFFGQQYTGLDRLGAALLWGLVFSLANGFMEELWLRGLFQKRLVPLLGGTGTVVLTSLWFALMHSGAVYIMPAVIPIFLVNAFTLGLACGYVMLKTDNLWGAALIHAGADLFLFVATLARP